MIGSDLTICMETFETVSKLLCKAIGKEYFDSKITTKNFSSIADFLEIPETPYM